MRISLASAPFFLFFLILVFTLTSCNRYTTNEFVTVNLDFQNVDWYAKRAQLAYSAPAEIQQALADVLHIETLVERDIQYFIEQLPENRQLLSVRGTANLVNVREDVEYRKSVNEKIHIYVHEGFDEDANAVFNSALPHLDKNQEIILTGHSLGAAVSSLLMIYFHHEDFKVGHSINFGQPKFTNRKGAETYDFLDLTRVVNDKDIVPLLPPATGFSSVHGEYRHFGQEVILLNGPHFVYLDNHIVVEKDLSELWANLEDLSVDDHMIANYRVNISDKFANQVEVPFSERHDYHEGVAEK